MSQNTRLLLQMMIMFLFCIISLCSFALNLTDKHVVVELGGFQSTQGKSQFIGINGLVGNDYLVTHCHDYNALAGLGYYLTGFEKNHFNLWYGINAFYLPTTEVKGNVIQEQLFNNLGFRYKISYLPVYASVKANINSHTNIFAITIDLGVGPNINTTSQYRENSLDGGITIPDNAFSGRTNMTFGAMAGVGIKINNVFGHASLECGYRFFYLGQNQFNRKTNQLVSNLKTGKSYANALLFSIVL